MIVVMTVAKSNQQFLPEVHQQPRHTCITGWSELKGLLQIGNALDDGVLVPTVIPLARKSVPQVTKAERKI